MQEKQKKTTIAFAIGLAVGMVLYLVVFELIWPALS